MNRVGVILLVCVAVVEMAGAQKAITQEELVRRAQELADSVAVGDQRPWKKYFAEDCLYFDEKGRSMDKTALVADVTPLPKGYSGTIRIVKPESRIVGDTAILSYDQDEVETVFGQRMTARYHETDTWMRRGENWQIVAAQVLRYYEDPAVGRAHVADYKAYAGTYELAPGNTLVISTDGKGLFRQRGEGAKVELIVEDGDIFFRRGVEGRLVFRRGEDGKVDALIDRRNNEDMVWKKIGQAGPGA